jgi:predicted ATPase
MKITFHNLGAVSEAEIDQKPLTIFVGPNNTGKTWTAYAIAGILGPWGFTFYSDAYMQGDVQEKYPTLENFSEQVTRTGSGAFDLA